MTPLTFVPLADGPQCVMDIDLDVLAERIKRNCTKDLPWFHQLPEFNKAKRNPISIVAGGPSLNEHLNELRKSDTIMVCGSSHDHVVSLGIMPRYCIISDQSSLVVEWLKKPCPLTTYLISTSCDDAVFEALSGYPVALWNALGGVPVETFGDWPAIGGGCTVTLRSICVAMMLGFSRLHFFGFDSCYYGDESHSYEAEKNHRSDPSRQERLTVRIGKPDGREFSINAAFLAQAQQFREMLAMLKFEPVVYGDGMIAEILRTGDENLHTA